MNTIKFATKTILTLGISLAIGPIFAQEVKEAEELNEVFKQTEVTNYKRKSNWKLLGLISLLGMSSLAEFHHAGASSLKND